MSTTASDPVDRLSTEPCVIECARDDRGVYVAVDRLSASLAFALRDFCEWGWTTEEMAGVRADKGGEFYLVRES